MIGTKFKKNNYDSAKYAEAAAWCNANEAMIIENGEYYEVVGIPSPSLEEVKEARVAALKESRDAEEVTPIEYEGNVYDYDDKARERMRIARQALEDGLTDTLKWTLADNTVTDVTIETFIGINNQAAVRSTQLHAKYNELKAKVEQAQTVEAVGMVKW